MEISTNMEISTLGLDVQRLRSRDISPGACHNFIRIYNQMNPVFRADHQAAPARAPGNVAVLNNVQRSFGVRRSNTKPARRVGDRTVQIVTTVRIFGKGK